MRKIFLFSVIFILLFSGFIAAIIWPFSKAVTCQNFNISGIDCETFWCNSIQGGNYSLEREICILQEIVNNTIYTNQTNETNSTLNSSEFYNRSEIDAKISDIKINFTQKYVLESDFENRLDDIDDKKSSGSGGLTGSEILIGFIVLVVIIGGFYFLNKNKQEKQPIERGEAPIHQKKIQTQKERELEKRITELEKKKSNKKTGKKKEKETEEFQDEEDFDQE